MGDTPTVVLDEAATLDRVGGDVEFLAEIADLFQEDCPKLVGELRDAIARGDRVMVERKAYTLKGSAANFGAEPARRAALKLELLGRGGDLKEAPQALTELEVEINRLTGALQAFANKCRTS